MILSRTMVFLCLCGPSFRKVNKWGCDLQSFRIQMETKKILIWNGTHGMGHRRTSFHLFGYGGPQCGLFVSSTTFAWNPALTRYWVSFGSKGWENTTLVGTNVKLRAPDQPHANKHRRGFPNAIPTSILQAHNGVEQQWLTE